MLKVKEIFRGNVAFELVMKDAWEHPDWPGLWGLPLPSLIAVPRFSLGTPLPLPHLTRKAWWSQVCPHPHPHPAAKMWVLQMVLEFRLLRVKPYLGSLCLTSQPRLLWFLLPRIGSPSVTRQVGVSGLSSAPAERLLLPPR